MNKAFMFMPLLISIFLSLPAMAQKFNQSCQPTLVERPLFLSCADGNELNPTYYSIEISKRTTPLVCSHVRATRDAYVLVANSEGTYFNYFTIPENEYVYDVLVSKTYFSSYAHGLHLLDCYASQGFGQGGFSVGN